MLKDVTGLPSVRATFMPSQWVYEYIVTEFKQVTPLPSEAVP